MQKIESGGSLQATPSLPLEVAPAEDSRDASRRRDKRSDETTKQNEDYARESARWWRRREAAVENGQRCIWSLGAPPGRMRMLEAEGRRRDDDWSWTFNGLSRERRMDGEEGVGPACDTTVATMDFAAAFQCLVLVRCLGQLRAAVSRSRRCALAAVQRPFRGCSGSIHARPEIGAAWQRELCPSLVATKRECLPACQPALDFRPASIITARRILFQTASLSASRQHSARPAQSRSMLVCNRDGRRVARISWYTLMRLSER